MFSSLIAELPDEGTHLRNSDRVKAIDRFVQYQKLRVVHDGKRNRQPLLHTKRILREKLLSLYGSPTKSNASLMAWRFGTPRKVAKIRRFPWRSDWDKNRAIQSDCQCGEAISFRSPAKVSPRFLPRRKWAASGQAAFSWSLSFLLRFFPADRRSFLFHMDTQIGNTLLGAILFCKMFGFDNVIAHISTSCLQIV